MPAQEQTKREEVIEIPVGRWMHKMRNNPWVVSTLVLALFFIAVLIFNPAFASNTVTAEEAGQNALSFLNTNPNLQGQVSLVSVQEEKGFYQVILNYQDQQVPLYVTLDGQYLLTGQPVSLVDAPTFDNVPTNLGNDQPGARTEVSEDDDAVLGDSNAPVTIIEFSDYQCPFCRKFWTDTLPLIKSEYIDAGKVKLIYRDFPLSLHEMAKPAAEAVECVRAQGGDDAYWKMHDKMFEEQNAIDGGTVRSTVGFTEEDINKWARDLGYDITQCLTNGEFADEVQADFAEGSVAGVTGTPAFYINGIKISGALPFEQFKQIIDAELAVK